MVSKGLMIFFIILTFLYVANAMLGGFLAWAYTNSPSEKKKKWVRGCTISTGFASLLLIVLGIILLVKKDKPIDQYFPL
jgi:hypothetical protein